MGKKIYDDDGKLRKVYNWKGELKQQFDDQGNLKHGSLADYERQAAERNRPGEGESFEDYLNDPEGQEEVKRILRGEEASGDGPGKGKHSGSGASPDELKDAEEEDRVGKGFTGATAAERAKKIKSNKWRKRAAWGGGAGVAGLVGGFGILSMTFGPLQFMHINQLLSNKHFGAQDDSGDDMLMRLMRYARFASKGTVEKTRLGMLGNRMVDRFEARLNSVGLKSGYTQVFGYFDGYVIDRSHPEFRGMNDQQLAKYMKDKYGVTVEDGSKFGGSPELKKTGTKVIDARRGKLGYFANRRFATTKLQQAGMNKITSRVAARLLQKRAGATFHPVKALDEKILRNIENSYQKWRERRAEKIKRGDHPSVRTSSEPRRTGDADADRRAANNADTARADADRVLEEGRAAGAEAKKGGPLTNFRNSLKAKIAGGTAAATVVPCILRALDTDSEKFKQQEIINPAIRLGAEARALGDQEAAGQDIDITQVGFYDEMANGVDSRGQKSSWSDAESIRANTGEVGKGVPPSPTLTEATKHSPFHFLNTDEPYKSTLDVLCSAAVQGGLIVLAFLGGPVSAAIGIVASIALLAPVLQSAAEWISGEPMPVEPRGADWGSAIDFGSHYGANEQALAMGGRIMSEAETQTLEKYNRQGAEAEFQSKSLAYRIFNPRDYRTVMGRWIDRQDMNGPMQNIASAFNSFLNVGSSFGNTMANVVSGRSYAAPRYYDYGTPKVGIPVTMMTDVRYQDPYENAGRVATSILEAPDGQSYIDRAKKCFGVTIAKDGNGKWNVTSSEDSSPLYSDLMSKDCTDVSEKWQRVQMFTAATVSMSAVACREDDPQACEDVGFQVSQPQSGGGGSPITGGGNTKELAKQILENSNLSFQTPAKRKAFEQVAADGFQKDCGGQVPISPDLLQLLLAASQTYKVVLGVFSTGHGCDNGTHPKGLAIDINGVAKGSVSTGNVFHLREMNAAQMALAKEFYTFIGNSFPPNVGGMGQVQCFPNPQPAKRQGVRYFADSCDHLHVDVRRNK